MDTYSETYWTPDHDALQEALIRAIESRGLMLQDDEGSGVTGHDSHHRIVQLNQVLSEHGKGNRANYGDIKLLGAILHPRLYAATCHDRSALKGGDSKRGVPTGVYRGGGRKRVANAEAILEDCKSMSRNAVADKHGVSVGTVYNILKGK